MGTEEGRLTLDQKTIDVLIANIIPTSKYFEIRFDHLEQDLNGVKKQIEEVKNDVKLLDEKQDRRFAAMQSDMDKRFTAMQGDMDKRFTAMQSDMDKRFTAMQSDMNKRFEQVDKRFAQMDEKLDHGSIIAQEVVPIIPSETRGQLEHRLTSLAYLLFKKVVTDLASQNNIESKEQTHEEATFTRQFGKNDGYIPVAILREATVSTTRKQSFLPAIINDYFDKNGREKNKYISSTLTLGIIIFRLFQGLNPWPGLWTTVTIKGIHKRLKLTDVETSEDGRLLIKTVQLEGKTEVDFETFEKAYGAMSSW